MHGELRAGELLDFRGGADVIPVTVRQHHQAHIFRAHRRTSQPAEEGLSLIGSTGIHRNDPVTAQDVARVESEADRGDSDRGHLCLLTAQQSGRPVVAHLLNAVGSPSIVKLYASLNPRPIDLLAAMSDLESRLQSAVGDRYRIEEELGGGGMSRVFLAEEVALGRPVVIKVLPPEMAAEVSKDRFQREIQLAAKLQHPHVVSLLTAGSCDDLLYYVMPYIEGDSLRSKLHREGELPVSEAVKILKEVVDALAYAHEQGVVHRDIKPDNVMISRRHAIGLLPRLQISARSNPRDGHHRSAPQTACRAGRGMRDHLPTSIR